jgi:hypothetical protein
MLFFLHQTLKSHRLCRRTYPGALLHCTRKLYFPRYTASFRSFLRAYTVSVVFNVVLLVVSSIPSQSSWVLFLMALNVYINIFGVVFATGEIAFHEASTAYSLPGYTTTVWNASFYRRLSGGDSENPRSISPLSPLAFRPTYTGAASPDSSMVMPPVSVTSGGRAATSTTSVSFLSFPSGKAKDQAEPRTVTGV